MNGALDTQTVVARFLPAYLQGHRLHPRQRQVCAHITRCRTPALGERRAQCESCGYEQVHYLSCRDRHCPKCQGRASARWRAREVGRALPVAYYHLVFTVPDTLNPWVQRNPAAVYGQLFESAWATLKAFGENPRHLGGQLGMTAVLHTWGQTLIQHVHLHCLVPGGALTEEGHWRAAKGDYLFPVRALSRRFRGHFVSGLRRRAQSGALASIARAELNTVLDRLMRQDWVVYAKACLGRTEQVIDYLARYTHRIALSDARLVGVREGKVGLRYIDYRDHRSRKCLWLEGVEFVRRLMLHVLPKGFMRIRHYGFLANSCRAKREPELRRALTALDQPQAPEPGEETSPPGATPEPERCPRCQSGLLRLTVMTSATTPDTG